MFFFHFSSPLEDSQRSWTEAGKSSASWPLNKPWGFNVRGKETISAIHPWKLTCPQKRDYFSREYIFQPLMFGGHVSFQGSKLFIQTKWVVGRVAFDVFFFFESEKKRSILVSRWWRYFIQLLEDCVPSLAFIQNSNESSNQLKIRKFGSGRQKKKLTQKNALQAGIREALASTYSYSQKFSDLSLWGLVFGFLWKEQNQQVANWIILLRIGCKKWKRAVETKPHGFDLG